MRRWQRRLRFCATCFGSVVVVVLGAALIDAAVSERTLIHDLKLVALVLPVLVVGAVGAAVVMIMES